MKEEEILPGLEKLLESLGVTLRYEKGDFVGGYCRVKDKPMMIVNNALNTNQKIKILARELTQMNLENVFIVPALREVIEGATASPAANEGGTLQNGVSFESA